MGRPNSGFKNQVQGVNQSGERGTMAFSPTPIYSFSFTNPTLPKRISSTPYAVNSKGITEDLIFNHDGSATKKLLEVMDMMADLVGVTLGPKGRNAVLQNKYVTPKIVNDGETILKQIKLEDPVENVGVKLVRQDGAKTNDLAIDGSTTAVILAHGLIIEGVKL